MHLPWTATLTTDDGALIQQIDLVAEVTPYRDAGVKTDDVMVLAVYVDHRRTPLAPPTLSRITGPLALALTEALEADPAFRERAGTCLCDREDDRHRPRRHRRQALIADSGVRFGRHPA